MACINPDGRPTESGAKVLRALEAGLRTAEEVAQASGLALFRARSGLRELTEVGLANHKGEGYELSPKGIELIGTLPPT